MNKSNQAFQEDNNTSLYIKFQVMCVPALPLSNAFVKDVKTITGVDQ